MVITSARESIGESGNSRDKPREEGCQFEARFHAKMALAGERAGSCGCVVGQLLSLLFLLDGEFRSVLLLLFRTWPGVIESQ